MVANNEVDQSTVSRIQHHQHLVAKQSSLPAAIEGTRLLSRLLPTTRFQAQQTFNSQPQTPERPLHVGLGHVRVVADCSTGLWTVVAVR